MAVGDGLTWGVATPIPVPSAPLAQITPFTQRDGTSYLESLEGLKYYLNNILVPEFNALMQSYQANFNTAAGQWTNQFNAYQASITAQLASLNDAGVAADVNSTTSATHTALEALYAHASDVATLNTLVNTGRLSAASLNAAYESLTAHAADITTLTNNLTTQTQRIDDNGWLFGCFTSNAGSAGQYGAGGESLSIFYSPDGRTAYSGGRHVAYSPADGLGLRDPSMIYYNNKYYVAYTRNNGADKNFAIAVSDTAAPGSFTLLATLNMGVNIASMVRCWAPEFVVDPVSGNVYIFFASVDANNHGSVYWIQANDTTLANWSVPTHMSWGTSGEPVHYIDPCLVKHTDGNWYLFYSTGNDILRAKSTTGLTGTYSTDQGASNWTGWGTSIEAPEIVWDENAAVYRGYFDRFGLGTGYAYSESTDLTVWTAPVTVGNAEGALRSTEVLRHGSFVQLKNRRQANKVIADQAMQAPVYHAQFTLSQVLSNAVQTKIGTVALDVNESLDANFVTVDASGNFTFKQAGVYAIDIGVGIPSGPTITRGFTSYVGGANGTTELKRESDGVENYGGLSFSNFKPRGAGETFYINAFKQWSSAETSVTLTGRIWITLLRAI